MMSEHTERANPNGAPIGRCIHELVEARAAEYPDAVAVVAGGGALTYGELNASSNRLARRLRLLGVVPGAQVAVCVERTPEMIVGILAALKAGGAYVPLDPSHPPDRLAHLIADCDPQVVLSTGHRFGYSKGVSGSVAVLDPRADAHLWWDEPDINCDRAEIGLAPDDLAYVIYTSGSTGKPKGVMVEHRGLYNLVTAQIREFRVERASRVLQVCSIHFDACASEIFMALCCGAALYLAPPGELLLCEALVRAVDDRAITHLTLTPTMLASLPEHARLGSVTTLTVAGEPLAGAVARRWAQGRRLINAYGPTEATICATSHDCTATVADPPPIGRPIDNVHVYILDRRGNVAPVGTRGELFIGGAGVARGYLRRAELTAERFVPDPFAGVAGARMYRTGDLGSWRPDGSIELFGRDDDQVKIRGCRVELGEIEAHLAAVEPVREVRVVLREDTPGDAVLVAYYTSEREPPHDVDGLRDRLARTLPDYMVPAAYVRVHALPLTLSGKLDRAALPAPTETAYATAGYQAPLGELESAMASIWREVLQLERVGRYDDFFKLGGHSLRAAMVISRIHQWFEIEVTLREIFEYPVLADLARHLGAVSRTRRSPISPIEPALRTQDPRVSLAQQGRWLLAQIAGVSRAYHVAIGPSGWTRPSGFRLTGPLDRASLRRALDRIVGRHEALRTTFAQGDGGPLQRIDPDGGFALQEHDLRARGDAAAQLERYKVEEATAAFDLQRGPLLRGRLIQLEDAEHVLLVTAHHIVADGWSTSLFVRELGALYRAYREGREDPLAPLPIQYADHAAWQRRSLTDDVLRTGVEYWREALEGAPAVLELPTDARRPARWDHAGAFAELELGEALTGALQTLSRRHGVTLYMTLLAGWAVLLARLSGQQDLVIGAPIAGRTRPEVEALIGLFVNTVALRLDVSGGPSVAALLQRVKHCVLTAQHHQQVPFEQVVEATNPSRSAAVTPLFQVMFAWQNHDITDLELPGLVVAAEPMPCHTAKFDLTFHLGEVGGRIVGGLEYATALFDRATIDRHLAYFHAVLGQMVTDEHQAVDRIALLSPAERRQLVTGWNPAMTDTRGAMCVERFEGQVVRCPAAIAVSCGDAVLSYAELNVRANRLAHHLRRLGVGPEVRVAISAERGLDMIAGVLAILKAGGTYVPLDPSYPAERLACMLADSRPQVLLAHARALRGWTEHARSDRALLVLDLEADAARWAGEPETSPDPWAVGLTPEHLAYVLYTSGSTGTPKGVAMSHRALSNLIRWQTSAAGALRTLQFAPLGFDVSFQEIFSTLCAGAELVLLDDELRRDASRLWQLICTRAIERLFLPYVALQMLAEQLDQDPGPGERACALREVITAGEQLRITPQITRMFEQLACRLYNHYGPTETHVATAFEMPCAGVRWPELPPIGRPIGNTRIYILDAHQQPVPRGTVGELYIGGVAVARGYLGRAELTAERFLPDAYSELRGARMYRTGDLGRHRSDGTIEFIGRNDLQVKIRGFRIELQEIEACLAMHPQVCEAVVAAPAAGAGQRRLVAYYTTHAGALETPAVEVLRAHVAAVLPEYMVPASYVQLAVLPRTPSGKLDRRALPALDERTHADPSAEAPVGEVETQLAAIWCDVLALEHVSRFGHFFELGGHSLLGTVLLLRVRAAFAIDLALEDLFRTPVLADLARVIVMKQLARFAEVDIQAIARSVR